MSGWPQLGRIRRLWSTIVSCLLLATACSSLEPGKRAGLSDDGAGGGIGGTGIIGVVTGVDDIVVNGRTVEVADDTVIREDGKNATIDDLQIGQVVQIRAAGPFERLSSRSIDIRHEVTGTIDKIDWAGGSITVLGQPVTFAKGAIIDLDPNIGDKVAVSGFRLNDRTIVATRVESVPSTRPAHLYGRYQVVDNTVQIEGVTITGLAASSDLSGREFFAEGVLTRDELTPTRFEAQARAPFNGLQHDLSIAGFIDARTQTLSRTAIANILVDVDRVTLADGRSESFGIFEGRLSSDSSVLNVENQLSAPSIFGPSVRNDSDDNRPDDRTDDDSDAPTFEEKDDDASDDGSSNSTGGGSGGNSGIDDSASDDDTGAGNGDTSAGKASNNSGNVIDTGIGIVDRTIDKVFGLDSFVGNKLDGIRERSRSRRNRNRGDRDDRDERDRAEASDSAGANDSGSADTDGGESSESADTGDDGAGGSNENADNSGGGNGNGSGAAGGGSNADAGGGSGNDDASNDQSSDRNDRGRGGLGDRVRDRIDNFRDGIGGIRR
jgi:hypothetical protein